MSVSATSFMLCPLLLPVLEHIIKEMNVFECYHPNFESKRIVIQFESRLSQQNVSFDMNGEHRMQRAM